MQAVIGKKRHIHCDIALYIVIYGWRLDVGKVGFHFTWKLAEAEAQCAVKSLKKTLQTLKKYDISEL